MRFKPIGDRLIVKRDAEREKTPGGIIIPDSAKDKPLFGKVLAVGKGKWTADGGEWITPEVKVGDRVCFFAYAGAEFELEGEKVLCLKEEDVLGVIPSPEVG